MCFSLVSYEHFFFKLRQFKQFNCLSVGLIFQFAYIVAGVRDGYTKEMKSRASGESSNDNKGKIWDVQAKKKKSGIGWIRCVRFLWDLMIE